MPKLTKSKITQKNKEVLIINRRTWSNILTQLAYEDNSELLNEQNRMCCLGFECLRRGFKRKDIKELANPSHLTNYSFNDFTYDQRKERKNKLTGLVNNKFNDSRVCKKLMSINDDARIKSLDVLEEKIATEFAKINVKVEYINDYQKSVYAAVKDRDSNV